MPRVEARHDGDLLAREQLRHDAVAEVALDELDRYVEIGLTPQEALYTATVAPPVFLELLDQDGTLASGRRADIVLNTGSAAIDGFKAQRTLASFACRADGSQVPLHSLANQNLIALAGIARPESFFAMLRATGLTLSETIALPDHYSFDSWLRNQYAGKQLICTEKDAVKLWQHEPQALAVPLVLEIEPGFFAALDAALHLKGIRGI
mgnify:CR=1 FL=1